MATISLYSRPELLRSGNQALRPAQFQLADSGLASGLGQIARVSAGIAADLNQKAQKADDASTLIKLNTSVNEAELQLSKWKMENSNNDQIMKNGSSLWEMESRKVYENIRAQYDAMDMTPETRERVNTIINHHANNSIANSWAGGVKQIGNNFDTNFNTVLGTVQQTGDDVIAIESVKTALEGNVINQAQADARYQAITNAKNQFKLTSINTQANTLMTKAPFDPEAFNKAKALYKNAFDLKLITKDEYDAQISNIEYKFQYNDKMNKFGIEATNDPVAVQNKLKNTQISTTGAVMVPDRVAIDTDGVQAPNYRDPTRQWQTSFKNPDGSSLNAMTQAFVVAPLKDKHLLGKKVVLTNKTTGKQIEAFVGDLGPNENGYGEMSWFAAKELGAWREGMGDSADQSQPIEWKFVDGAVSTGEFSWMSTVDFEKAKIDVSAAVTKKAVDSFNTIKNSIDIDQVLPDALAVGTNATPFSKVKNNPNYKALFQSDDEDIKLMRISLEGYANNKADKLMIDDDMLYEDVISQISTYNAGNDPSSKKYVALSSRISTGFTGPKQKELQERLDKQKELGLDFKNNSISSDAIVSLNKAAFEDQMFGTYKKSMLVQISDQEDRKITQGDIDAQTLFELPDPNNPDQKTRRVATPEDISAGITSGTKRWVIPQKAKANSVTYLQAEKDSSGALVGTKDEKGNIIQPKLTVVEVKEENWKTAENMTPVFEEDPYMKEAITKKVKSIREIIENETRDGKTIKNKEDAIKRMEQLSQMYVNKSIDFGVKSTEASTNDQSAISSPTAKKNKLQMARQKAGIK